MVVVLGMLASLGWGIGDFGGGLTSRHAPAATVLFWSQAASLLVGIPVLLLATTEPAMGSSDWLIAIVAGTLGASGLGLLYRGLAVGRMGVVAPVAAILTAIIPVVFGFVTQGIPSALAIVGIGIALVSVLLVSRTPDSADGRPSGLWYAVGAGTVFGSFAIAASLLGDGLVVTPIVIIRITSVAAVGTWLLVRGGTWRVPKRLWPALLFVGVIDMSATAAYLLSIAIGPLAIAAILASLYPVVTTILATVILRERITRGHAVGILAAGAAVALIAGAGAG